MGGLERETKREKSSISSTGEEKYDEVIAQDDPTNLTDPTGKDCAGGPTTPTAVANFVNAYEASEFDQYEEGVQFDNAAAFDQYEEGVEFDNAVSAFKAKTAIYGCMLVISSLCGLANTKLPTPTVRDAKPQVQAEKPKGAKEWPLPPIPEAPSDMSDAGGILDTIGDALEGLAIAF